MSISPTSISTRANHPQVPHRIILLSRTQTSAKQPPTHIPSTPTIIYQDVQVPQGRRHPSRARLERSPGRCQQVHRSHPRGSKERCQCHRLPRSLYSWISMVCNRLTKHGQISLFIFRSIWANSPTENAPWINEYFKNSLERESPEMDQIRAAVREAGVFVVLGYSERYKGTLYIAQVSCATERTTRRTDGVSLLSTRPAPLFFTAARSSPPTLSVLSTVTDRANL